MRNLLLTLTLLTPLAHAEPSNLEKLQELEKFREVAQAGIRRQDEALARYMCNQSIDPDCKTQAIDILKRYTANAIDMYKVETQYQELKTQLTGQSYGIKLEDTDPNSYPAGQ